MQTLSKSGVHGLSTQRRTPAAVPYESVPGVGEAAAWWAGSIRNPTPARNGLSSASFRSHGLTRPHHPLDADGGGLPKGNPQTIVIGKSGLDDLLLYLAVQGQRDLGAAIRTLISGSCSASSVKAWCRRAASAGRAGMTTVSKVGGANAAAEVTRRRPTVAHTGVSQAPHPGDPSGRDCLGGRAAPDNADP